MKPMVSDYDCSEWKVYHLFKVDYRRVLENGNHKPIRGAYKIEVELRLLLSVVKKISALCFELHTIFTEL